MTEQERIVRRLATERGLDPDLAVSVWQQESNKSTDTGLRGPDLSRGRGNAIGPWQVVPYYHPEFPVEGSFEEQTAYGLDYLKKVGPAKYYGTGQAPPGQPTTEQYVNQVLSRVPGQTVDAAQIAPGPAYQGGSVQPVSAGQPMMQPNIPPQPGIPQMPPIDPSMFTPEPMDRIRQGLGIMAQVLGGGRNVLGGAGLSNQMGGYGNYAAMLQLQMKAQDRQYKQQMQKWEQQRDQAIIESLPEEERGIAKILGPTDWVKQKVTADLKGDDLQLKQVIGPDGKPVFVREEDALGMEPYSTPLVSMGEKFGEPPGEGSSWLDPKEGKYQSPTGPNGEMQVQFLRGSEGWRKQKAFEAVPKRLTSSLDRLEAAVDKYGVTKLPSVAQGELQTTYASFILQAKEAEKLGALAGPDLDLIEGLIGNPTKWNQLKNKEVILRQIRVAREIMIERGIIEGSIDPGSVSTETPEQKADRIWDMP